MRTTKDMKFILLILFAFGCAESPRTASSSAAPASAPDTTRLNPTGTTVATRFPAPSGFERRPLEPGSFAHYLRHLPLKPHGAKVKYFDGTVKDNGVYVAVVDMDLSRRDLQQCADAIMRLRAEHLYAQGRFSEISFTLTNGFKMDYSEWIKGRRVRVNGNETTWVQGAPPGNRLAEFRSYLEFVFTYAGTLSLSRSLRACDLHDLAIGDVFIMGGSPGHAVIVVDLVQNEAGEKKFLLAQSYMPAQETQILINPQEPDLSPWYSLPLSGTLETPEWTFQSAHLKTW